MSHPTSAGAHSAPDSGAAYVVAFEDLRMTDVESVGGKNASLGEMISQLAHVGVRVPGGFATTAQAFRDFLSYRAGGGAALADRIADRLAHLDIDDVRAVAVPVLRHRVVLNYKAEADGFTVDAILKSLL